MGNYMLAWSHNKEIDMTFTVEELKLIKEVVETKQGLTAYQGVVQVLNNIVKKCEGDTI